MKIAGIGELLILFTAFVTDEEACQVKWARKKKDDTESVSATAVDIADTGADESRDSPIQDPTIPVNKAEDTLENLEDKVLEKINGVRTKLGLGKVGWNTNLATMAKIQLEALAKCGGNGGGIMGHYIIRGPIPYGFDDILRQGVAGDLDVKSAVDLWIQNGNKWYKDNKCSAHAPEGICEPYEKMIKADLKRVACAEKDCHGHAISMRVACLFGLKNDDYLD